MTSLTGLNFFILKYDPILDEVIWGECATGSSSDGQSIVTDGTDFYVVGLYNQGSQFGDTTLLNDNGFHNMFTAKYDQNGNLSWIRTVIGEAEIHGYGIDIANDQIYVAGEYEGQAQIGTQTFISQGYYDAILIKYDSNGNEIWANSFGGPESDEGYDVKLDSNGDPILLFECGENATYSAQNILIQGWNEPVLIKIHQSSGDIIWQKSLQSTPTSGQVSSVRLALDGVDLAVTGINRSVIYNGTNTYTANNNNDFYVATFTDTLTYHLGIDEQSFSHLIAYPNPTENTLNFKNISSPIQIRILDAKGTIVRQETLDEINNSIQLDNLISGVYFVHSHTTSGATSRLKIIKL